MKLTKSRLKQIIKEELQHVLKEYQESVPPHMSDPNYWKDPKNVEAYEAHRTRIDQSDLEREQRAADPEGWGQTVMFRDEGGAYTQDDDEFAATMERGEPISGDWRNRVTNKVVWDTAKEYEKAPGNVRWK